MKTICKALACGLLVAGFVVKTQAAGLQGAGNLLVNFDPSNASNYETGIVATGFISNIINTGTLGGVFDATGQNPLTVSTATFNTNDFSYYSNNTPNGGPPVVIQTSGGAYGVMFDERNWMQLKNTNALFPGGVLTGTNIVLTSTTIAGTNPAASIEVWAESPSITDEGTLVSWGLRANGGQNMAFTYGAGGVGIVSGAGAVDHEAGATDAKGTGEGMTMNWGGVPPRMGVWHHLVYTCDGTTTKVYCDGQLMNSAQMATFVISPFYTINIAAQHTTANGFTNNPSGTASGGTHSLATIGRVRIWDGVLTQTEIQNNYSLEAPYFVDTPTALTAAPIHNYVFTNAAVTDATGQVIADIGSLGNAPGTVMGVFGNGHQWMTGSALHLDGGTTATGPFLQFPGYFQSYSMLTNLSAAYGGPGQLTIEGWVVPRGQRADGGGTWQALFSFGSSSGNGGGLTNGIITNTGAAGGGNNYIEMTELGGDLDESRQEILCSSNLNGSSNVDSVYDYGSEWMHAPDRIQHYAVTWNEATGEVVTYINGHEQMRRITVNKMNQITDANAMLGRDEYGDETLQADYSGFRIYNYVLSPGQVLNDYQAGPKQVATSLASPSALHISTMFTNTWTGEYTWLYVTEDFTGGASGVDVTGNSGIKVTSDNSGVAEVGNGHVKYVGVGTAHIVATNTGTGLTTTLTVNVTAPTLTLAHEYTMTNPPASPFLFSINDTITQGTQPGVWTGVCNPNGAAVVETNQLVLNGTSLTDMEFPANLITGDEAVTVEAWASFGNTTVNNFFYGFGDTDPVGAGRWYMFASTHSSIRIATTDGDPGYASEAQTVFEGQVTDGQTNVHWVAVYDPPQGYEKIYLNGVPYEQCTNVVMPFSQSEVDNFNYLGRSLFTADPFFSGSIAEFRVFNGAMSSNQVALDFAAGAYNTNILNGNPGTLNSVVLIGSNNVPQSVVWQTEFYGNYANVTNVNLFFYTPCGTGSDDPTVCTITPSGVVTAVGAGTTLIHATNIATGQSASATVSVVNLIPTLQHRWSFTGGSYADSVGGPTFTALPQGTAQIINNQLVLDGTSGYLVLPGTNEPANGGGILSNYVAYSFEAWVSVASNNPAVSYLYAFGDINPVNLLGRDYVALSPNAGNTTIASITQGDPGNNGAQLATYGLSSLDGPTNTYVAVVEHPYGGFEELFINGGLVAVNTNITTFFSSVVDNFSYLGKSLYSTDPLMSGSIDEFRIWSGVLTKAQIVVDNAAGPNEVTPGQTSVGTFVSAALLVNSNMALNTSQVADLSAIYTSYTNINIFNFITPPPKLVSGNTNVVTVTALNISGSATNVITAVGPGTATVTVNYNSSNYTATITVGLPQGPQLMHEYSFNDQVGSTSITDSIGNLTGTLPNGGTLDGLGHISFIGTNSQYLNLPGGILSNYAQVTIDMWVTSMSASSTSAPYVYLWSIGNTDGGNGDDYIFFNPNLGRMTISATDPGFNAEQGFSFGTLDAYNTTGVHVTGVYNVPGSLQLYTNGVLAESDSTGITDPLSVVGTQFAYFGQSLYPGDTYMNFSLDELRIYSGALDAASVASLQAAGPGSTVLQPKYSLSIAHVTNNVYNITYPWLAAEYGYGVLSSTNIGTPGHFTPVAGTPLNVGGGNYQVQITASNTATFYSLGK